MQQRELSAVPHPRSSAPPPVFLDGSHGEGGGQILRTALTLSLLTGRPFRISKIRANREPTGLRPQHLWAVKAAALLGRAEVDGDQVGSRVLTFRPKPYVAHDIAIDIGTAGSTSLVLQTLHLPLALRATRPVRVVLTGGTFNTKAPSFPFLDLTWRRYMGALALPVALAMPSAGFFPIGGGQLEAWIEPGTPRPIKLLTRGLLQGVHGLAGISNLRGRSIPERMQRVAETDLAGRVPFPEVVPIEWPSPGQGAAISLTAEYEYVNGTFVGLGVKGKPAEDVASEACSELLAYTDAEGVVDPYSADQIVLPLAFAQGRSEYTVAEVTDHLRTNIVTVRAFLDREIRLDESSAGPARVIVA
jgi:RNA 3'-terminal phosphate cyclase (ATP)